MGNGAAPVLASAKSLFETISAGVKAIEDVSKLLEDSLNSRSVIVEVDNNTPIILGVQSNHHDHGGFAAVPDAQIAPYSPSVYGSQSAGLLTGTEGTVVYSGDGLTLTIHWDNPWAGGNSANATLDGPNKDKYRVFFDAGAGDRKAMMRYQLFASGAWFEGQDVPDVMKPYSQYPVSVSFRNVSRFTWAADSNVRLGAQNPQDNQRWGMQRVPLAASVLPNGIAVFKFMVTAPPIFLEPKDKARANFQWRMVNDGVEWFGDFTPNVAVTVWPS